MRALTVQGVFFSAVYFGEKINESSIPREIDLREGYLHFFFSQKHDRRGNDIIRIEKRRFFFFW